MHLTPWEYGMLTAIAAAASNKGRTPGGFSASRMGLALLLAALARESERNRDGGWCAMRNLRDRIEDCKKHRNQVAVNGLMPRLGKERYFRQPLITPVYEMQALREKRRDNAFLDSDQLLALANLPFSELVEE